jgi:hypothetical protein
MRAMEFGSTNGPLAAVFEVMIIGCEFRRRIALTGFAARSS